MTTKITEQNISNLANAAVQWQSVVTADGSTTTTLVAGRGYFIDTTSAAHTVVLPTTPNVGDTIQIRDYSGTFGTNNLTVDRNGHNLGGSAVNGSITSNNTFLTYVYVDSTKGWLTLEAEAQSNPLAPLFTEATGGTITTSGDYKIHTFTGDGCFAVTQAGNNPYNPTGGPDTVSYLVVAGGGGTGSGLAGGGGAGGFREGRDITPSYTASPLVAPTGLTITATTYPVTVGGGGARGGADGGDGSQGSNSIFSTITSTGGGFGAGYGPPGGTGGAGGSGGGGGGNASNPGGAGNTPPVSPSQGNNGSNGRGGPQPEGRGGGGGGGATATGGPNPGALNFGNGGAGATTNITGSPVTYAGGGGGNGDCVPAPAPSANGSGGPGGGGNGRPNGNCGQAGSSNTGGGGGGGGAGSNNGGAGGSGIVIIRYKYQ